MLVPSVIKPPGEREKGCILGLVVDTGVAGAINHAQ
jgi:hypothetical protein